jgi:hypothetical protein
MGVEFKGTSLSDTAGAGEASGRRDVADPMGGACDVVIVGGVAALGMGPLFGSGPSRLCNSIKPKAATNTRPTTSAIPRTVPLCREVIVTPGIWVCSVGAEVSADSKASLARVVRGNAKAPTARPAAWMVPAIRSTDSLALRGANSASPRASSATFE